MRLLLLLLLCLPGGRLPAAEADLAAQVAALQERLATVEATASAAKASVDSTAFNAGDNAWVLLGALLVLLMTIPGLALFYGGLVRRRNVLGTMMQSLAITALVSVAWAACGFGLAFGGGSRWWIGGFDWLFLEGVAWTRSTADLAGSIPGPNGAYAASIPFATFCLFQMMFAVITPAVICGAYAERMTFRAMALFSLAWLFLVYIPLAHMAWGVGGLFNWAAGATRFAAFDFAGGTVVETASGVSGLVCALILGKRRRYREEPMPPHNLTMAFTGACLLWVGWFGFNAASALSCGGLASLAAINTHLAASAATIAWPLAEWILRGKPTVLGAISGAVAGLVAITPACGFVTPASALMIGSVAGVLCYLACSTLKNAFSYDDSLDVFGVHGVAGIWGTVATGIFFARDANPGLKAMNPELYAMIGDGRHSVVLGQLTAVGITILIASVMSAVILLAIKATLGLRMPASDETEGLDLTQHGEDGYHGMSG